ncbi:MAG: YjgN family protein [Woeseiaceae bacterium]
MEAQQAQAPRTATVKFTGNAGEYFKIWIVNIALTVVTLGIYSAWAKVRKLRYFYGNTSIEDGHLDYHAKPTAILFGRVIAVGMLFAYYLLSQYEPVAGLVLIAIIVLLIPVLVVRANIFHLRNTSYHGLRFNFQRNYKDSFIVFYGGVLIAVFSLGLAVPSVIYMRNKFIANNTGYGQTQFEFGGRQGEFYAIFWRSVGLALLGVLGIMLVVGMLGAAIEALAGGTSSAGSPAAAAMAILTVLPLLAFYAAIGIYVQTRQRNYVWNSTTLGDNSFESTLSVRSMVFILLTNAVAIAVSLGLLIPWAQIRLARYRAEHMTVHLADDWREYIAAKDSQGSSLGEEIGDAFDVAVDVAF